MAELTLDDVMKPRQDLTLDEIMKPRAGRAWDALSKVPGAGYATSLAKRVKQGIAPDIDPRFKNLQRIPWEDIMPPEQVPEGTPFSFSKMNPLREPDIRDTRMQEAVARNSLMKDKQKLIEGVAQDDDQLTDIVVANLGKRLLKREKDAHGYDVLTYLAPDGKVKSGYVNTPGLDTQDLRRTAYTGVGYGLTGLAAAGAGGAGAGAGALARRAAMQAAAAGATSLAMDTAAGYMGSDEGLDLQRAMIAAGFGAGGEIGNAAIGRALQNRKIRQLFVNGTLTAKGRQLMEAFGLAPDEIEQKFQRQFAEEVIRARDPLAAARKVAMQNRGLNPTTSQVTGHEMDVLMEKEASKQFYDSDRYRPSTEFAKRYAEQKETVEKSGRAFNENYFNSVDASRRNVGEQLRRGLETKFDDVSRQETEAWKRVDTYRPTADDLSDLKTAYKGLVLKDPKVWDKLNSLSPEVHPNALAARDKLVLLMRGKLKTTPPKGLNIRREVMDIDAVRRELSGLRGKAFKNSATDYEATDKVLDIYNDWLEDLARNKSVPQAIDLMKARDLSAQIKATFGTTGNPANDPGGKFIKEILDKSDTSAEAIATNILDGSRGLAIWRKINEIFPPGSDELNLVKASAFDQIFFDKKTGHLLSFKEIEKQFHTRMEGQKQLYQEMFTPEEQRAVARFYRDIRSLELKDVPAGIKSDNRIAMERLRRDGFMRYIFRSKGQSARFTGKPMESIAWHWLARSSLSLPLYNSARHRAARGLTEKMLRAYLPYKNPDAINPGIAGGMGATFGGKTGDE